MLAIMSGVSCLIRANAPRLSTAMNSLPWLPLPEEPQMILGYSMRPTGPTRTTSMSPAYNSERGVPEIGHSTGCISCRSRSRRLHSSEERNSLSKPFDLLVAQTSGFCHTRIEPAGTRYGDAYLLASRFIREMGPTAPAPVAG